MPLPQELGSPLAQHNRLTGLFGLAALDPAIHPRLIERDLFVGKIDVSPPKPEQFTHPHSSARCQQHERPMHDHQAYSDLPRNLWWNHDLLVLAPTTGTFDVAGFHGIEVCCDEFVLAAEGEQPTESMLGLLHGFSGEIMLRVVIAMSHFFTSSTRTSST